MHNALHLFTYVCKQCGKKQTVYFGRMLDALPGGWIRLIGYENVIVCSLDCAMAQLSDWADEIEQKWGWVQ